MNASSLWLDAPPYFSNDIPSDIKWDMIRKQRRERLSACDWTQLADAPLNEDQVATWRTYRQMLRDLPQIFVNADDVVFTDPPA